MSASQDKKNGTHGIVRHHRACNLCEAICGVVIEVEDGRVLSIKGDPDDPLSHGHICPKATALQDLYEDPDRLVRPLRRRPGRDGSGGLDDFEEIEWSTAFDEVAAKLRAVQKQHGKSAVAVYQGNPTVHSVGALLFSPLFTKALHTRSHYSATSLDQLPHMLASLEMFGNQFTIPVPDVDRTKLMIIIGANPLASNGSMMTAPGMKRRLREIRERGGKVIVIDPRRTETADVADQHLFIRPGTDAALLLAMVRVLFEEKLASHASLGRVASLVDASDVSALRDAAMTLDLAAAAAATGVAVDDIRMLARGLAQTRGAVIYGRVGVCTQDLGGLAAWLLVVLNAITGNLDDTGGAMFTTPAIDLVPLAAKIGMRGHFARRKSRVRGLPEFGGEYPATCLAEEIDTPGEGRVRALVTSAGNPVLSAPNGRRLERALPGLELMVSIDPYLNETTRHAHYILPPTSPLERDHYDVVFHALAVRNTARYSEALFERPNHARHDWEIFLALTTRMTQGKRARLGTHAAAFALRRSGPRALVDLTLRTSKSRLSVKKLVASKHGVDLGPLEPRLAQLVAGKDKRVKLAPRLFLDDVPRLLAMVAREGGAAAGLVLIGRRDLRSNNSWMHNSARLVKGPARCTLLMHPDDAAARGLSAGQPVSLSSPAGAVTVPLELSDAMMRGVVSLPHGWGHDRKGARLRVAVAHAGASINDVIGSDRVDALTGNASFSGTPVEVQAVAAVLSRSPASPIAAAE